MFFFCMGNTGNSRLSNGIPFIPVYRSKLGQITGLQNKKQPEILVNWKKGREYRHIGGNLYTGIDGIKYSYTVGNPIKERK